MGGIALPLGTLVMRLDLYANLSLLCQDALSQINPNTDFCSVAIRCTSHARKAVVTWPTGRPWTNRSLTSLATDLVMPCA